MLGPAQRLTCLFRVDACLLQTHDLYFSYRPICIFTQHLGGRLYNNSSGLEGIYHNLRHQKASLVNYVLASQMDITSSFMISTSNKLQLEVDLVPPCDWWLDLLQISERGACTATTTYSSDVPNEHTASTYPESLSLISNYSGSSPSPNEFLRPGSALSFDNHSTEQHRILIEGGCFPSTRVKSEVSFCDSIREYD